MEEFSNKDHSTKLGQNAKFVPFCICPLGNISSLSARINDFEWLKLPLLKSAICSSSLKHMTL